MSFITKKHLSRRTFLRGAGVTLSLPFLESMVPAQTPLAKTAANPRMRMALCFMPHGAVMANWTPAEEGAHRTCREQHRADEQEADAELPQRRGIVEGASARQMFAQLVLDLAAHGRFDLVPVQRRVA